MKKLSGLETQTFFQDLFNFFEWNYWEIPSVSLIPDSLRPKANVSNFPEGIGYHDTRNRSAIPPLVSNSKSTSKIVDFVRSYIHQLDYFPLIYCGGGKS